MDEEEVESSGKTIGEHIAGLRYRKWLIIAVSSIVMCAGFVAALVMPATFKSSATILVREQEVSPELVRSTITSFADERIQVIGQQVMTRAVLLGIVEKYDLYKKERKRLKPEEILVRMRRDIVIAPVDVNISDRGSGRRVNTTIAFQISYESSNPVTAQKVVEDLVELYLNENAKAREDSIARTNLFLEQESERAAQQLQTIEVELSAFKQKYADRMPQAAEYTIQLADRLQSEIQHIEREIGFARDRRQSVETQLSLARPNLPSPVAAATASSSSDRVTLAPTEERVLILQGQLAAAESQYQPAHPEVVRLRREIATLKSEMESAGVGNSSTNAGEKKGAADGPQQVAGASQNTRRSPDNPIYITLLAQLDGARRNIESLTAHREALVSRQRLVDTRLREMPEADREFRDLVRNYDAAKERYREVRAKQGQAEIARELERDHRAERFTTGEPANFPERPVRPNRTVIALLSVVGALLAGLVAGWLRESFDPSIKGPLDLARATTVPIFSPIPYIATRSEEAESSRRTWLIGLLYLAIVLGVLALIHFGIKPIPEILENALRRVI